MPANKSDPRKTKSRPPVPERGEGGRFLAMGKPGNPKAPETRKTPARKTTQAAIIATIRRNVEIKLKKDAKATLGDYIRLIQLQKDLEDEEIQEIRVTWVEPKKTEVESEK
jgi:hypothetical protein